MRHRHRDAVGELHSGIFEDRPHSRLRRHLFPAAPRRRGAPLGLSLTGDKLSAEQAAEWGLIWQCVDDGQLPVVIDKLLAQLAQGPTRGLGAIKRAIHASASNTLALQLDLERDVQRQLGFAEDYREGVAAFAGKRAPRFTGR